MTAEFHSDDNGRRRRTAQASGCRGSCGVDLGRELGYVDAVSGPTSVEAVLDSALGRALDGTSLVSCGPGRRVLEVVS